MKDNNYNNSMYDYNKADNSHYSAPSWYGKVCREQYNQRPTYNTSQKMGGGLQGAKRNTQKGP